MTYGGNAGYPYINPFRLIQSTGESWPTSLPKPSASLLQDNSMSVLGKRRGTIEEIIRKTTMSFSWENSSNGERERVFFSAAQVHINCLFLCLAEKMRRRRFNWAKFALLKIFKRLCFVHITKSLRCLESNVVSVVCGIWKERRPTFEHWWFLELSIFWRIRFMYFWTIIMPKKYTNCSCLKFGSVNGKIVKSGLWKPSNVKTVWTITMPKKIN